MRRFIIKICITAVTLFVLAWGLDMLMTWNLHNRRIRMFSTYNDILTDTLNCNAVVMGSSRGQVQFDVRIIDSITGLDCYNISVDGRCIDAEVTIYNLYRRHYFKPRLIIQNIDWGTLLMSNGYEREQYLPYIREDKTLFNEIRERENFTWTDYYLPLVRYAGYHKIIRKGLDFRHARPHDPYYKGYIAHNAPWDGSVFRQIDTLDFTVNPDAEAIFDRYLAQCQKEGVKVVMVYAPIYIGVTRKMGAAVDSMFALYRSYADRYGCPILNYTYDSISYDTLNFYNASHMNRRGAEEFSIKLASDLKELLK